MTLYLKRKKATLFAILLVVMMILFSLFIGNVLSKTLSYILTFCVYWFVFCLPISFCYLGRIDGIKTIYESKKDLTVKKYIFSMLAFLPCIATFSVVFVNVLLIAPLKVFLIAILFSVINGIVEELFWRGVFVALFPKDILFGYVIPSFLFGLWHIALYFSKGIIYQGGFVSLVGGSMFMGFLWGLIAYKTKGIKLVTAAHVITNFFAFSGLIYENWFILAH